MDRVVPNVERALSEHFTLAELTHSDLAAREGIDNTPPEELMPNHLRLAAGAEQCRAYLAQRAGHEVPMIPLSGFRCEALERLLCARDFTAWCKRHGKDQLDLAWRQYFASKRHPRGLALDFIAPRFGTPFLVATILAGSVIAFDQLIYEYTWVHISFPELDKPVRRDVLTLMADGSYAKGIAERKS